MLLAADEPAPARVLRPDGGSVFLLTADHAGRAIPRALRDLGLPGTELGRHIAWDIGIAAVTARLSALLDATAVLQTFSRLVIDCNRRPDVPSSIQVVSESTEIPGNAALSDADRAARVADIFTPYHTEIAALLDARQAAGRRSVLVAMHSFTPVYLGEIRPMHVAVLYNRAPALSRLLARLLREEHGLVVAENEPYAVSDETDYGVPVHAERRGLDHVEIEIRQDLIGEAAGQEAWAARFARLLPRAEMMLQEERA
jgi:predicted N-formylglutamate amidohydrolase